MALAMLVPQGMAAACTNMTFDSASYSVCEVAPDADLRLFLAGPAGPLQSFAAIDAMLDGAGERLAFAMNAGMYHYDLTPVGLYVENGREVTPLVTRDGPGNFGLLPNGVFCIAGRYLVIESRNFAAEKPACTFATQSGPMVLIKGKPHPQFLKNSDSLNIRNGVGVSADGSRAVFVISNSTVNFYDFARFFRDGLGLSDALYLDGSISRLYAPELGRHDGGFPMGPIVGLVVPKG